jgi:hypothetical protein
MTYSSMRGSDYLLQENKMRVIAKKFNPVNRAEFNPGVERFPCNRPLSTIMTQPGEYINVGW